MIVSVGEILVDMIGGNRGGDFVYERKAGGAPFNVACAAKKLGAQVAFVGCVGDDTMGAFLTEFAASRGIDELQIQKSTQHNTTLAFVDISAAGERSFCFYRKNTADMRLPQVSNELLARADIVHIGSLMLSEKNGVKYALSLIRSAHKLGKRVSFDVNYRTDIFRDREQAVATYKKVIAQADIVKFSEDELEIFTREYAQELAKTKLLAISLGGEGSMWMYGGKSEIVPTISVESVDTTGAGDAFFAGVLAGLEKLCAPYSQSDLNGIFRFANVCGALNTLGRGAIDSLPSVEDVKARLSVAVNDGGGAQ